MQSVFISILICPNWLEIKTGITFETSVKLKTQNPLVSLNEQAKLAVLSVILAKVGRSVCSQQIYSSVLLHLSFLRKTVNQKLG